MRTGCCWLAVVAICSENLFGRAGEAVPGPEGVVVSASRLASEVGAAVLAGAAPAIPEPGS